uniref:Putative secreted protein n=1 Tax=Anopheles darlingi TaxID=43151 RepID=A0A2M4D9Q5_ANODA
MMEALLLLLLLQSFGCYRLLRTVIRISHAYNRCAGCILSLVPLSVRALQQYNVCVCGVLSVLDVLCPGGELLSSRRIFIEYRTTDRML